MKFKVGEMAIVRGIREYAGILEGEEVVIAYAEKTTAELPSGKSVAVDYLVVSTHGLHRWAAEWQLRKRPQPGIPKAILRIFEVEAKQERPA